LTYSAGTGSDADAATATVAYDGTASAQTSAQAAISRIDTALTTVASDRASLGALQSQLESTVRNLANVAENTAAAAGRIMDTDYAAETANLTKAQILQQAATSILAQANAQPQSVLSLLQ
jgi:flagellin